MTCLKNATTVVNMTNTKHEARISCWEYVVLGEATVLAVLGVNKLTELSRGVIVDFEYLVKIQLKKFTWTLPVPRTPPPIFLLAKSTC